MLPALWVLSDGARGYDIAHQLRRVPKNCVVIDRTFGQAPVTRAQKGQPLRLATSTAKAVRRAKLDGIHWPAHRLKHRRRSAQKGLIETGSAHHGRQIGAALLAGVRDIAISTAFESDSPSAASRPLGPVRLALLARQWPRARLYALGGVTQTRARRLVGTGLCGVALVSLKA